MTVSTLSSFAFSASSSSSTSSMVASQSSSSAVAPSNASMNDMFSSMALSDAQAQEEKLKLEASLLCLMEGITKNLKTLAEKNAQLKAQKAEMEGQFKLSTTLLKKELDTSKQVVSSLEKEVQDLSSHYSWMKNFFMGHDHRTQNGEYTSRPILSENQKKVSVIKPGSFLSIHFKKN